VFGFYLMDGPDPTGQWNPLCLAANLKAEADWIHANDPDAKTFIVLMNMGSSSNPSFTNTYNPSDSDIDLYGVDPYPCRTELSGCDYSMIGAYVNGVTASGVPAADIVPVYQTFGGGSSVDDGDGAYALPTADQETQILATWLTLIPSPPMDYAYSWGSQSNDTALAQSSELQSVFASHNAASLSSPNPTPTPTPSPSPPPGPVTAWHYAPNGNFDSSGTYTPATDGFNVADVTDLSTVNSLPSGDKGLVWVGQCGGATTTFTSAISPFIGNPKVLGFYLMDEPDPDPAGVYGPYCPQANLKAESDWIHANDPGAKTCHHPAEHGQSHRPPTSPLAAVTTRPTPTSICMGMIPYPCRSGYYGTNGDCDYSRIGASVNAVIASGVPLADIVPVYQAFGGGGYLTYVLPSAAQETQLLATWAGLTPSPVFDYAYSWGSQNNDTALAQSPQLQSVFGLHNAR